MRSQEQRQHEMEGIEYLQSDYDYENEKPTYESDCQYPPQDMQLSEQIHLMNKNSQCHYNQLIEKILKQNEVVNDITGFGKQRSLIYFYGCQWNIQKCDSKKIYNDFIDLICYKSSYKQDQSKRFKKIGFKQCKICYLQDQIFQNLCGCSYCKDCWQKHIQTRIKHFNQVLPICLDQNCKERISYMLALQIGLSNESFKKLFTEALCNSYCQKNKLVKKCMEINCDNFFIINNVLQTLQCNQCNNFICPNCGKDYHQPSDCLHLYMWENSLSYIEQYQYRFCPKCNRLVEKQSGCNYVICICQNAFCYICGQNWQPYHREHNQCYRQQIDPNWHYQIVISNQIMFQIGKSNKLIKKRQNIQIKIDEISYRIIEAESLPIQDIKEKLVEKLNGQIFNLQFLNQWMRIYILGLKFCKNSALYTYFHQDSLLKIKTNNLKEKLNQVYNFLFKIIQNQYYNQKNVDEYSSQFHQQKVKTSTQISSIYEILNIQENNRQF